MSVVVTSLCIYPLKSARAIALPSVAFDAWGLEHDRRWMAVVAGDAGSAAARFLSQRQNARLATVIAEPVLSGGVADAGLAVAGAGAVAALRLTSARADAAAPPPLLVPLLLAAAPGAACRSVRIWSDTMTAVDQGDAAAAWLRRALAGEGQDAEEDIRLVYADPAVSHRLVDTAYAAGREETGFSDGFPVLLTSVASLAALNAGIAARAAAAGEPAAPPLPMARFRPNIVVDAAPGEAPLEAWAEDSWRAFAITPPQAAPASGVAAAGVKRCSRCLVTTTDQLTGAREPGAKSSTSEPLRTLSQLRSDTARKGAYFGMNVLLRAHAGTLRVGDVVRVAEAGPIPPYFE